VRRLGFRGRLFVILFSFAFVPSALVLAAWGASGRWVLPLVGATAAWDSVGATGRVAIADVRRSRLDPATRAAIDRHEALLDESVKHARQTEVVIRGATTWLAIAAVFIFALLSFGASRVAGHLSRNLSRPLQELVGWTALIGQGQPIPDGTSRRGAPEFQVLREHMRAMSRELQVSQARALGVERASAQRESARQFAHELKNPLTPIRFAVERLRREAPPHLADTVHVLAMETERLDSMARSFSQFGRLPEGAAADIDIAELARYTARSGIPDRITADVEAPDDLPMIRGHYDALARALANVVLNAVDACSADGTVTIRVRKAALAGRPAVEVAVQDSGCGIPPERLADIWEPYVTTKVGGTGLGLAITRQTVLAHDGAVSAESTPGLGTTIRLTLPVHFVHPENAHD